MKKISIIDYKNCNIGSIVNMLKYIGIPCEICNKPDLLINSEKILLPGVGSFDSAMKNIVALGFLDILNHKAKIEKVPILGICLGMQLLTYSSEEGKLPGLGWIAGETRRFLKESGVKVPHMGWNEAEPITISRLTSDVSKESRYYFVHSYYVQTNNPDHVIMQTNYGLSFNSAIGRDNIYGVQFHPEKSHKFGMQILKNFSEI